MDCTDLYEELLILYEEEDYENFIDRFGKVWSILTGEECQDLEIIADCQRMLSHAYRITGYLEQAKDPMLKALKYYREYLPATDILIARAYSNLANVSFELEEYEQAKQYLDSSLQIQKGNYTGSYGYALNLLGKVHAREGNYLMAKSLFRSAEQFYKYCRPDGQESMYRQQAALYTELLKYDESNASLENIKNDPVEMAYKHCQLGCNFLEQGQLDSAKYYFDLEEELRALDDFLALGYLSQNRGAIAFEKGQYYEALIHMKEAVKYHNRLPEPPTSSLNYLSRIYSFVGNTDEALRYNNSLLAQLREDEDFRLRDDLVLLYNSLEIRLEHWKQTQDREILDAAYQMFDDVNRDIAASRKNLKGDVAKHTFSAMVKMIYHEAIKICNVLYEETGDEKYLHTIVRLMEGAKGLTLREKRLSAPLDFNQFKKEEELLQYAERLNDCSDSLSCLTRAEAFYDTLMMFERVSSTHQFDADTLDVEVLPTGVYYVNYFQHLDKSLSIVTIKDGVANHAFIQDTTWYAAVSQVLDSIHNSRSRIVPLQKNLAKLTEWLMPDLEDDGLPVVIVPDGILNFFPFEALRIGDEYLMEQRPVSYAFSLRLTDQMQGEYKHKSMIAFAPDFSGNTSVTSRTLPESTKLGHLKHSLEEVEALGDSYPEFQVFTGADATISNFFEYSDSASIIHLATHAIAGTGPRDEGAIYFSNSDNAAFLTIDDIERMHIPADMVVMSACQTAKGRLVEGEGVMSFARAFAASGVHAAIGTLWSVNDVTTKAIMMSFYDLLRQGKTKDEALRMAKIRYMEAVDGPYRHPYYWSGIICIGDSNMVSSFRKRFVSRSVLLFLGATSLIVLIGRYSFFRNSSST